MEKRKRDRDCDDRELYNLRKKYKKLKRRFRDRKKSSSDDDRYMSSDCDLQIRGKQILVYYGIWYGEHDIVLCMYLLIALGNKENFT